MEDLISVIIPVYNTSDTLDKCMQSVINQTYSNLEIILVESASTDNSGEICDQYEQLDNRVKVIHQTERKGLSNARNTGLEYATGAYVGFVDSDDWITLDMYEILLNSLKQKNADIACGQVYRTETEEVQDFSGQSFTVDVLSKDEYALMFFRTKSNKTVHYVWSKLYKQNVAKKIHFPEGLLAEDVKGFFDALISAEKIVNVNREMYYYRNNPNGLSGNLFSKKQLDIIKVWKYIYDYCKNNKPEWSEYAKVNYYRAYFGVLTRLIISGQSKEFPEEKKQLLMRVKQYYKCLMKSTIPKSRKLLLTGMCINYDLTERGLRFLYKRGIVKTY